MRLFRSAVPLLCVTLLLSLGASMAGVDTPPGNTPVGKDVTVTPIPGVKLIFTDVIQAGNTTATRTDLTPENRMSPCGTFIPTFLQPPAGDNHFTVYRVETTAGFTDSTDLNLIHPDTNAHVFKAVCPPPRDPGWEDVTILPVPGDPRSRVPSFSEFIIVTDPRPVSILINNKFGALSWMVNSAGDFAPFIDPATLSSLQSQVSAVGQAISSGNKPAAIALLQNFNMFVQAASGAQIPNNANAPGGNITGKLLSKASSLIFSLSL